jgi:prepilin signal peptidase PulO-like enzyme (type II secretory pathway)
MAPASTEPDTVREPLGALLRRDGVPIAILAIALAGFGIVVTSAGTPAGDAPDQAVWLGTALALAAAPVAACVVIDARTHRIPTPLVRVIALVGVGMVGASAAATGTWADLGRAIAALLAVGAAFAALWWVTRGGTGPGDVRLAAALALYTGWLGWSVTLWFVVAAYFAAFPVALYRLLRGRRDPMAFGPALVAGWYLALGWAVFGPMGSAGS